MKSCMLWWFIFFPLGCDGCSLVWDMLSIVQSCDVQDVQYRPRFKSRLWIPFIYTVVLDFDMMLTIVYPGCQRYIGEALLSRLDKLATDKWLQKPHKEIMRREKTVSMLEHTIRFDSSAQHQQIFYQTMNLTS